jgi:excinuclease ABC subunit A
MCIRSPRPATPLAPWRFSTDCTARTATSPTRIPVPAPSVSIRPSAPARPAAVSAAASASTTAWSFPIRLLELRGGAIKPWQTESYKECQADLDEIRAQARHSRRHALARSDRGAAQLGIDGEGEWTKNVWYGVRRFFAWLETKAYKMHIRVLLSRYRSYTECAPATARAQTRCPAVAGRLSPGINIRELMLLSIDEAAAFFAALTLPRRSTRPLIYCCAKSARASILDRRRPGLSQSRSPVAHTVRRRSTADQSHHRAGHLAGQHPVRAR